MSMQNCDVNGSFHLGKVQGLQLILMLARVDLWAGCLANFSFVGVASWHKTEVVEKI